MPGNNGTPLTVHGSFLRSDNCDKEFSRIAQKFAEKNQLALTDNTNPNLSTPGAKTQTAPGIKISLGVEQNLLPTPADPSASNATSKAPLQE